MTGTHSTLDQTWSALLSQLQTQLQQPAFGEWLRSARLVALEDGVCHIEAPNEATRDWLAHQMSLLIERTLSAMLGQSITLEVGLAQSISTDQPSEPAVPVATVRAPPDPGIVFAHTHNFEQLWAKSGFTQVADYVIHYWRIHLGRAFDLWEFLVSEDRRDVKRMKR